MRTTSDHIFRFDWTAIGSNGAMAGGLKIESQAFRDEQYEFINTFIEFVRRLPDLPDWYRTPVDLLEAARIELMFQSRTAVRDWMSWKSLVDLNPNQVEILVPPSSRRTLERDCRQMTLPFNVRLSDIDRQAPTLPSKDHGHFRLAAYRLADRLESRWALRYDVPQANPERIRAVFLDHYPNSTHVLIPVWRQLSSDDYQCLYIAGRGKVHGELGKHGIASLNLRRCGPRVSSSQLVPPVWSSLTRHFFDHIEGQSRVPTPPSVLAAFNDLAALISEVKLTSIRLQRIFDEFRPNLFFVSSGAYPSARIGELLCRKHRCGSFHLQHGLYKGEKENRNLLSESTCLWGNFHRRCMEQNPCPGKLLVTGSPKHDELRLKYSSIAQSDRPLVVFYSTRKASSLVGADDFERHLLTIYAAARAMRDVEFVVKLHPAEQRTVVEALIADRLRPTNLHITHSDDAYYLLQRCHLVVTVSSTIGYEALLFNRPLLILNLTGGKEELTLPESPSIMKVTRPEDLVPAIEQLLAVGETITDSTGDYWLNDGHSLDRILKLAQSRLSELSIKCRADI